MLVLLVMEICEKLLWDMNAIFFNLKNILIPIGKLAVFVKTSQATICRADDPVQVTCSLLSSADVYITCDAGDNLAGGSRRHSGIIRVLCSGKNVIWGKLTTF